MMNRKEQFIKDVSSMGTYHMLILVIELPSKALETMINTSMIAEKIEYVMRTYNDELCMHNNKDVKIKGWLIV